MPIPKRKSAKAKKAPVKVRDLKARKNPKGTNRTTQVTKMPLPPAPGYYHYP